MKNDPIIQKMRISENNKYGEAWKEHVKNMLRNVHGSIAEFKVSYKNKPNLSFEKINESFAIVPFDLKETITDIFYDKREDKIA